MPATSMRWPGLRHGCGSTAQGATEGRVGGPARELFLDMNGRALRAEDPPVRRDLASAAVGGRL